MKKYFFDLLKFFIQVWFKTPSFVQEFLKVFFAFSAIILAFVFYWIVMSFFLENPIWFKRGQMFLHALFAFSWGYYIIIVSRTKNEYFLCASFFILTFLTGMLTYPPIKCTIITAPIYLLGVIVSWRNFSKKSSKNLTIQATSN